MKEYRMVSGDLWDIISNKCYGTENNIHILMEANPEYMDVVIFSADVLLKVPEIKHDKISKDLPPWKVI